MRPSHARARAAGYIDALTDHADCRLLYHPEDRFAYASGRRDGKLIKQIKQTNSAKEDFS